MDKIIDLMKDIIKSLTVGIIASITLMVISGLFSILLNDRNLTVTLDSIKNTLFIIGGLGLFVWAGFIAKRDARRPLENKKEWKEQFKVIHFINVLGIIDITILFAGIILDKVIFYL